MTTKQKLEQEFDTTVEVTTIINREQTTMHSFSYRGHNIYLEQYSNPAGYIINIYTDRSINLVEGLDVNDLNKSINWIKQIIKSKL